MPTSIIEMIAERNELQAELNQTNGYKARWALQEEINGLDDLIDFELDLCESEQFDARVALAEYHP